MINLVHLYDSPGGIEVLLPGLSEALYNRQFRAYVIRPPRTVCQSVYDRTDVKVTYGSRNNLIAIIRLTIYAIKRKDEVFHVFNIGPLFLLILRLSGIKRLIYSIHGTKYWKTKEQKILRKTLWNIALKRNYVLTSNSIFSGSVFGKEIHPSKTIELLYNPIDSRRFKPESDKIRVSKPVKIVYSGRLVKGKNLIRWIEIAVFLKQNFSDCFFEIYGSGPERDSLKQVILDRNLESFIFLKGHLNEPEKIYQVADLLIFLSEYESFGNVVVESIMCETPVIASSIPSMKEIFRDFPVFLVDLDDKLEENILNKVKSLDKLNSTAKEARISFIERFDSEKHYSRLRNLYEKL